MSEIQGNTPGNVACTRRRWLTLQACMAGADILTAVEAVASVAIEHPEWDMEEMRTYDEWARAES